MKTNIKEYKNFLKDKSTEELESGLKAILPEVKKEKNAIKFHEKCIKLIKREIRIKKAGGERDMALDYIVTLVMGFEAVIGIITIAINIAIAEIFTPSFVLFWLLLPITLIGMYRRGIKRRFSEFVLKRGKKKFQDQRTEGDNN